MMTIEECLEWMEKYKSTSVSLIALEALQNGDPGPYAVMINLAEHLRQSYPKTPVDCLISELRDEFHPGGVFCKNTFNFKYDVALYKFDNRVSQFKAEIKNARS